MKGEELEFRDVYLKWGVIERQKHLKKLCKELKIDYKDALLFGFFYVNKEGNLKFKIAGFIKKEKDELFFDEKVISQNISIKIEDYQFLKFNVINEKLEEYVNYADTVKLSCTYKKEDKMNLLKTREIKELDKYRDDLTKAAYSAGYLTADELKELTNEDLKIMRNYPYAVAGYDFSDKKLKDYFSKFLWYIPIGKNVELTKDDYEVINNVDKIIKSRGK